MRREWKPGDHVVLARSNSMKESEFQRDWKGRTGIVLDYPSTQEYSGTADVWMQLDDTCPRPDWSTNVPFNWPGDAIEFADPLSEDEVQAAIQSILEVTHGEVDRST